MVCFEELQSHSDGKTEEKPEPLYTVFHDPQHMFRSQRARSHATTIIQF
jgi:hypothetical protein